VERRIEAKPTKGRDSVHTLALPSCTSLLDASGGRVSAGEALPGTEEGSGRDSVQLRGQPPGFVLRRQFGACLGSFHTAFPRIASHRLTGVRPHGALAATS